MKLCAITAAHNLYIEEPKTRKKMYADELEIYIDYQSADDYGLKFYVDPKQTLVHPDYINYKEKNKDLALIELSDR